MGLNLCVWISIWSLNTLPFGIAKILLVSKILRYRFSSYMAVYLELPAQYSQELGPKNQADLSSIPLRSHVTSASY